MAKTKMICPCCNKMVTTVKFKPGKGQNRDLYKESEQFVVCPECESYPRHRIVCNWLNDNQIKPKQKVLIFAISQPYKTYFCRNEIEYVSADLYDQEADRIIDIQDIPIKANKIDFISCDHVLEHVDDYHKALAELFRILKPGGILEITVPIWKDLATTYEDFSITSQTKRMWAFGQTDHKRVFGKDFPKQLKKAGFMVEALKGDDAPDEILAITGPANYDINVVFICRKPQ